MTTQPVQHRGITCPYCNTVNTVIGSDVPAGTSVTCSQCGLPIGHYSSMRPHWSSLEFDEIARIRVETGLSRT